jgi:Zn finger protein HypA/HybF involved in hydrogenase expression
MEAQDTRFNCPWCDQSLEAPAEMAGETVPCPACAKELRIPLPGVDQTNGTATPQANATKAPTSTPDAGLPVEYKDATTPGTLYCHACRQIMAKELKKCPHCGAERKPTKEDELAGNIAALACLVSFLVLVGFIAHSCLTEPSQSIATSPNVRTEKTCRATCKCFGALSKSDLQRAIDMHASGDNTAFMQMFLAGRLVDIPAGTTVTVEDTTVFGEARVRVQGQTDPVWVISNWFN